MILKKGDLVKFVSEKLRYTVRCAQGNFAICTKPFNLRKTVLYTIVDFKNSIRGRDNMVFGMGYESDEQCEGNLRALLDGTMAVSRRNRVPLDIESVTKGRAAK